MIFVLHFDCCSMVIDRVFGYDSSTREVYDEAAKSVVLSVLSGMNGMFCSFSCVIIH